jgi:hypothetical protein
MAANCLWLAACAGNHRRFVDSLTEPAREQRRVLEGILRRDGRCEYARSAGFDGAETLEEFRRLAPLADHEDHAPFVEAALHRAGTVTAEPITRLHPSSGTTSASKLIPYNAALAAGFAAAVDPWIFSLYTRRPGILGGSVYWSISPPSTRPLPGGHGKTRFSDDSEYLSLAGRLAFPCVSAAPGNLAQIVSPHRFKVELWARLLAAEDLAFISVWSPTYLIALCRWLEANTDEVLERLFRSSRSPAERARRSRVTALLRQEDVGAWASRLWPRLVQISCWTHGTSAPHAADLAALFPQTEIEGKGLVATEAAVSIPLRDGADPVLAVRSHFFEFLAGNGELLLAHQVEKGAVYSLVVTNGGGLYRYRLHDLVEVTGWLAGTPTLRFLSKDDCVSDQAGEKLNAVHVQRCLDDLVRRHGLTGFYLLAPTTRDGALGYALYVEAEAIDDQRRVGMAQELDRALQENFHYDHCRRMGQLLAPVVVPIPRGSRPLERYLEVVRGRGPALGEIKPQVLDASTAWDACFLAGPGASREERREP